MFNLIVYLILQVGAINWLCIGLFQVDIIASIFGSQAHFLSRFIYVIIGFASVYLLIYSAVKKFKFDLLDKK